MSLTDKIMGMTDKSDELMQDITKNNGELFDIISEVTRTINNTYELVQILDYELFGAEDKLTEGLMLRHRVNFDRHNALLRTIMDNLFSIKQAMESGVGA